MTNASTQAALASISDEEAVARLQQAKDQIVGQLGRVIVGMEQVIDEMLIAIFARGHCLLVGVPGLAKTLLVSSLAQTLSLVVQAHPVHARPDALGHHRHGDPPGRPGDAASGSSSSSRGRSSPTSSWPTRSTARRPRRRRPCWRPCRRRRSPSAARTTRWRSRSSCWPRRTPSSRKAPTRCPRPSSTASCSTSRWTIRAGTRRSRS